MNSGEVLHLPLEIDKHCYVQYTGEARDGSLLRILPGIYTSDLDHDALSALVAGPEVFITQCFLKLLLKEIPGTKKMGSFQIPESALGIPPMQMSPVSEDPSKRWIVDSTGEGIPAIRFQELHPDIDIRDLPHTFIPFPDTLQELIRDGWLPRYGDTPKWYAEQDSQQAHVSSVPTPQEVTTTYFGFVRDRTSAESVAVALSDIDDLQSEIKAVADASDGLNWLIKLSQPGMPSASLEERFEAELVHHGGDFDGTEVGPL
jgi:hypothetical protein